MGKKGHSERGFFGNINHYDDNGKKIGESRPGFFGGYVNYDEKGNKTGRSEPGLLGGYTHYDNEGKKTGHSAPGTLGGYNHYDSHNKKTGTSSPNLTGGYNHSEGCYIATCVYGSYDCREVWILRRYRDYKLAKTFLGRVFIRVYYLFSPMLVRLFGKYEFFKGFWRKRLDKITRKLHKKGFEDTPYEDK